MISIDFECISFILMHSVYHSMIYLWEVSYYWHEWKRDSEWAMSSSGDKNKRGIASWRGIVIVIRAEGTEKSDFLSPFLPTILLRINVIKAKS